jgi:hypothetical protein
MNSIDKGYLGEMKVAAWAAEKGYVLSKPLCEARYDFILDDGFQLHRVQVKYVDYTRKDMGAIQVDFRSECRNSGYRKLYSDSEIDLMLVYIASLDVVCKLMPDDFKGKTSMSLRTCPPKNNQQKGVQYLKDYLC